MSLSTYSELQSSITNWLRRDGDTNLVATAPDLILLLEAQLNRDLRHRRMETNTTLTLSTSTDLVALPSDYIETKTLTVQTSPLTPMTFVSQSQLIQNHRDGSTGIPTEYTIVGDNIKVGESPDSGYSVELVYFQQVPDLATNLTNWVLTHHPDIYLFGSLLQASPFLGDDERVPVWAAYYERAREGLKNDAARSSYSGGPLYSRVGVTVA